MCLSHLIQFFRKIQAGMSRKYRIGNDLEIQWTVNLHNSDGTLVDLTSLNLGVQLIVGQKIFEVQEPTIAANLITFLFPGSEQKYDGPYVVKLYDKDNTTITYDVRNAFILTDHSWMANETYTPEDITVEIETDINAVQIITIAGPQGPKGDKGDTGSKGATGEDGADGVNGTDGVDGADGKDGKDGIDGTNGSNGVNGRSIRTTVFEEGKQYYDGDTLAPNGIYYLDIVADKAMVVDGEEDIHYYVCASSHVAASGEVLTDTTLWAPMTNTGPIVTPLVLAEQIKARFIDVDNLSVKHLDAADGTFKGKFDAEATVIDQYDDTYVHSLDLDPEIFSISAVCTDTQRAEEEYVRMWPLPDPDAHDRTGLVEIMANGVDTCAICISGMVKGLSQGVEVITDDMSPYYNLNTSYHTFVLNVSSAITLHWFGNVEALKGQQYSFINLSGKAFTLVLDAWSGTQPYMRVITSGSSASDRGRVTSHEFSASIIKVDLISDGGDWITVAY